MSETPYSCLTLETLFFEVTGQPQVCRANIAEALERGGLVVGPEPGLPSEPGYWTIGPEMPDPDEARRYGFEVFPPLGDCIGPGSSWVLAHSAAAALGADARVEPTFSGDVVIRTADTVADPEAGRAPDGPAPEDVRWHLRRTSVFEAHERLRSAGVEPGAGVHIGHPDTGYTEHPQIFGGTPSPIDVNLGLNLLEQGRLPLDPLSSGFLKQPGHGTATAAVVVARDGILVDRPGSTPVDLLGVAPAARIAPIRVTESVVVLGWQRRLAIAIEHAVDRHCRVISISLGGLGGSRLNRAIRYAERQGVIIVSAAGNEVKFVVAPATHPLTIAAAASDSEDRPWRGSSRGRAVTITAPGHQVWVAGWAGSRPIAKAGSGTSFATAHVAGAAALWLSAHAVALVGQESRAARLFRAALRRTARPLPTLPTHLYGAGLVDCEALVVSGPPSLGGEAVESEDRTPEACTLEALLEPETPTTASIGQPTPKWYDALSPSLQSELAFHLTLDDEMRSRWRRGVARAGTQGVAPELADAGGEYSPQLADALTSIGPPE